MDFHLSLTVRSSSLHHQESPLKESTQNKNKSRVASIVTSSPVASTQRQMFGGKVILQAVTKHFGGPVSSGICFGNPPHVLKLNGLAVYRLYVLVSSMPSSD